VEDGVVQGSECALVPLEAKAGHQYWACFRSPSNSTTQSLMKHTDLRVCTYVLELQSLFLEQRFYIQLKPFAVPYWNAALHTSMRMDQR